MTVASYWLTVWGSLWLVISSGPLPGSSCDYVASGFLLHPKHDSHKGHSLPNRWTHGLPASILLDQPVVRLTLHQSRANFMMSHCFNFKTPKRLLWHRRLFLFCVDMARGRLFTLFLSPLPALPLILTSPCWGQVNVRKNKTACRKQKRFSSNNCIFKALMVLFFPYEWASVNVLKLDEFDSLPPWLWNQRTAP